MAENILLPYHTGITALSDLGVYADFTPATEEMFSNWNGNSDTPIEGNIFVEFDGVTYECTPQRLAVMDNSMAVGNCTAFGGTGNSEPFIITIIANQGENGNVTNSYSWAIGVLTDTAPTEHTVEVYQVEASTAFAVVLKDRSGADVTYEVPSEQIKLNTPDGTQIFTAGQAVDNVSVTLDLANGDQTVTAGEGQLIKSAVIQKPATLSPANIVKDVNIAGVVGTFEGGGGGDNRETEIIEGTISGSYTNATCQYIKSYAFQNCSSLTAVDFPMCSSIGNYAFASCMGLTTANFPMCSSIGDYVFINCSNLTTINISRCTAIGISTFQSCYSLKNIYSPECESIGHQAFEYCSSLNTVYAPECKRIWDEAFFSCTMLSEATYPKCSYIGVSAFAGCTMLSEANFPECVTLSTSAFAFNSALVNANFPKASLIPSSAFYRCRSLKTAYFPNASSVGVCAFSSCIALNSVNFSAVTDIGNSAFYNVNGLTELSSSVFPICSIIAGSAFAFCYGLSSVYFPMVRTIYSYVFYSCKKLQTAIFPVCGAIFSYAFNQCSSLASLYLFSTSVPSLSSYVFNTTPFGASSYLGGIYGSIYVRESLADTYKTAKNWSNYASRIVGLTDEQIAAILEG